MTNVPVCMCLAVVTVLGLLSHPVQASVQLRHLSSIYLPAAENKKPEMGAGAVEQIAYDPQTKLIYAVGTNVYHVLSARDAGNLQVEHTEYADGVDFTDVDVCGDHVFMTVQEPSNPKGNSLRIYKSYAKSVQDPLDLVDSYNTGSLPDMLTILEDCRTVIVADEGEAYTDLSGKIVDPEGQVVILRFPDGVESTNSKAIVTFTKFNAFNDRVHQLKQTGLRFVYPGNGNQLSNDLEPEYIAVDEVENKAYVVLQENNAVAEVDLTTQNITNIWGLGYKQWGGLDASDKDDGIRITYWPIRAWYQPDSTKLHRWRGRKLLFTANEGADKAYTWFEEAIRGDDISNKDLGPGIHPILKSAIRDDEQLGRLEFSRYDGRDDSGKYSDLYTFGGRSFSIWDLTSAGESHTPSTLPLVFDSGSQLEELTAAHCPHLFNRKTDQDDRSDKKGPEPESLALAELNGRLYIFVGIERPGIIVVYSLGDDVSKPRFETMYCDGIPDSSKSMKEMFKDREIYAVDPEDIR
ncbi:hypothetical protein EGW08_022663 [Elysia chlorotica]|uniref:Choice-of-anchor I domain-containing protein n=1 Tax=Elysia chlorotica TaxID=188477 RepID=A0A433SKL0_ELYCH|nr:hypothetical protein EGW08_022663 [Elysia chlorotica]